MIPNTITKCPFCEGELLSHTITYDCLKGHILIWKRSPDIILRLEFGANTDSIYIKNNEIILFKNDKHKQFVLETQNFHLKPIDDNKIEELFHILKAVRTFQ